MSMRAAAADKFYRVGPCVLRPEEFKNNKIREIRFWLKGIIRHQNRYLRQKILRIFVLGRSLQIEVAGGAL